MENIDLSIIIINHYHGAFLKDNISSIYNKTSNLNFEIILIYNTPNDEIFWVLLKLTDLDYCSLFLKKLKYK